MTLWRWLTTPAEPRGVYMLATGIGTGVLMLVSLPLWSGQGVVSTGIAGGICGGVSGILAKLWMERRA